MTGYEVVVMGEWVGDKTKDYLGKGRHMPKKKSTPRKNKKSGFYPVVRGSELGSTSETNIVRLVDTARNLSLLNRRLYRYTRCYSAKISQDAMSTQTAEVYALRNDWAVHKGLQMAYKMYLQNTEDERNAMATGQVARWEDFRVDSGIPSFEALLPVLHSNAVGSFLLNQGEFNLSNVVDSSNVRRTFSWTNAPLPTEYSILNEYDKAGNAQLSPSSVPTDMPYANIETQVNDATADDLKEDGNSPPYDSLGVNADTPWVRIATLGSGVGGVQQLSTGYFDAPCGIIMVVGNTATFNSNSLRLEVKSGEYKGVHAPSMLE